MRFIMEPTDGFEPSTCCLRITHCRSWLVWLNRLACRRRLVDDVRAIRHHKALDVVPRPRHSFK